MKENTDYVEFTAVMEFRLPIDQAVDIAAILNEDHRRKTLAAALRQEHPINDKCYCDDNLIKELGIALAKQRIEERRLLTAPLGEAVPMEVVA